MDAKSVEKRFCWVLPLGRESLRMLEEAGEARLAKIKYGRFYQDGYVSLRSHNTL